MIQRKIAEGYESRCCWKPAYLCWSGGNPDSGTTHWHECTACCYVCDVEPCERKPVTEEQGKRDAEERAKKEKGK